MKLKLALYHFYFRKQTKSIKRIQKSPILKYESTLLKDP